MPRSIQRALDQVPDVVASTSLIDKRDGKPKRVPKRVQQAIRLIYSGECKYMKDAAKRVSMSPEHLSRMLRKEHVQVFVAGQRRQTLAEGAMRATARLNELVDAASEHVALQASTFHLGVQGVAPKGQGISVDVNIRAGFVIDISESDAPGARVIDGQAISVDTAAIDNKEK